MRIKERCWRYDTVNGAYFVKFYEDDYQVQKVRTLHRRLAASYFPYSVPITSREQSPYIVQQWIEGEAANYEQQNHRNQTLHMLESLHAHTKDWIIPYMSTQNLVEKWRARLVRFQQQEHVLRPFMGAHYDIIVQQATFALQQMKATKPKNYAVLHGDVVHHNFLLGDKPVLIDFDLAHLGDPAEEVILWMHRVLPHMDYDVERLVQEQPYVKIALPKIHYLLYPNEVLREWLYMLQVDEEKKASILIYLRPFTTEMIARLPQMNQQITRLTSY